jgi:hypothetical protein
VEEVKIHYLNWDEEEERGEAHELFHDFHGFTEDEIPELTEEDFQELYREVASLQTGYESPERFWSEWNAGSGEESQEFYDAEVRSMSVGDIVEIGKTYYQARSAGFEEIELKDGDL